MSAAVDSHLVSLLKSLSGAASATVILVGSLVLIGWLFHLPGLNELHPVLGTMSSHTAFCFIFSGTALALLRNDRAPQWKLRLAQACAIVVVLISMLTLGVSWFGWRLEVDQFLFTGAIGTVFPGRMPAATALAFLLLGLALLLFDVEIRCCRPAESLTFAAALIALLAVIAYSYGFISFAPVPARRPLAFHSVLTLLVLSFGILMARPQSGLMRLANSNSSGGIMIRRLLPAAVGISVLLGWLVMEGQRAGFYPPALNLAFYASSIVVVFSTLIWLTGGSLHRVDVRRQRAEERIRRLNAELEQRVVERTAQLEAANRELESFSYSVSHDLRAPLRAMDGFSRILLQEHSERLSEEGRRYLQMVRDNADQMGQLIDDLLAFSRLSRQPLKREPVAPSNLVRQVLNDLAEQQNNRHTEIVVADLPACRADPALLKQVFVNLLGNALKFTQQRELARIEVGSKQHDGELAYYVRDNGVGFDMQYAHKLFGVFQRLHRAEEYPGTGVGLAIVQRIINRHGGRVWAEAQVDRGATFYFTLGGANS